MSIYIKTLFFSVSVAIAVGFSVGHCAAQSTGPAALAAKQAIKAQVLSAMNDGNISEKERRAILLKAKEICTAKEYVGLVETMNRLSAPDRSTPKDLGYIPITNKQFMASFPTPDLSWFEKSPVAQAMPKLSVAKQTSPQQTVVVRETITKQTIVKETIPQQSIAKSTNSKESVAKESVAKSATTKQPVAKKTTTNQTVAKKTVSNAGDKLVMLPPPQQQKSAKKLAPSAAEKSQGKVSRTDEPAPPMPPAVQPKTQNASTHKQAQEKTAVSRQKPSVTPDQVTIQQPAQLLKKADNASIKSSYTDYSVPVLTTPAAALLVDRRSDSIKAAYDQSIEPDGDSQRIIKR
jgi:hypothetical protein